MMNLEKVEQLHSQRDGQEALTDNLQRRPIQLKQLSKILVMAIYITGTLSHL